MYQLDENHHFNIENYQTLPTFSSFLPGVAGESGLPIWAFYVNRGQGIASFGVQDKDHAIMEFLPADKSYQLVQTQGFRTFVKIIDGTSNQVVEPFAAHDTTGHTKMEIAENMLTLHYHHEVHEFSLTVNYFALPNTPVAGLVRQVTFKNHAKDERTFELLDGLPSIFPSGVDNAAYKELGNTLKSWFDVKNLENQLPFYFLRGSTADSAEVTRITQGNFYYSTVYFRGQESIVKPIIDKKLIFGSDTTLQTTFPFNHTPLNQLKNQTEQTTNRVSGGFTPIDVTLQESEEINWSTVVGYATSLDHVNSYVKQELSYTILQEKKQEALTITNHITSPITSETNEALFDAYSRQSYLDNGLRGGFPHVFVHGDKETIYYLYSRKHGDLERDYNFFSLSPTYYSQGNGNYRDINQNRRCDVFFEPKVKDYNLKMFMNLIQLDGYNPLGVKGVRFTLKTEDFDFDMYLDKDDIVSLKAFFDKSYTPGELKHYIEEERISLKTDFELFLAHVLSESDENFEAEYHEGFWVDHWTYNLDLIESYLAIYPDLTKELYFAKDYRFFNSPAEVKKREDKYVLVGDDLRQYNALHMNKDKPQSDWVRTLKDPDVVYETTLYSKLLTLGLVKTATLAPFGLGIEMEADKPGWNDSLNGLPGMIGSSTSELYEVKRLFDLLLAVNHSETVAIPVEVDELLTHVVAAIQEYTKGEQSEQAYWHDVATHRENYRHKIYKGLSGDEVMSSTDDLREKLQLLNSRIKQAIKAVESFDSELIPTYFYFELADKVSYTSNEKIDVESLTFKAKAVTPFLEGLVKALKLKEDKEAAKALYNQVKQSNIYDKKLGMYKTSMSIKGEKDELGRASAFTPGWLENESVFLHMEYKYLLATLKSGLTEEFYADMKQALIPFLDPKMYGRSTLENSSFIASSANPDPDVHGRGFVARLSGSTIEFMNMWFVMMTGGKPFVMADDTLTLALRPQLPGWMFKANGEVKVNFLGQVNVAYSNPSRTDTFGERGVGPVRYTLTMKDGSIEIIEGPYIKGDRAYDVRSGNVIDIQCELA